MRCPECQTLDIRVLETRQRDNSTITRRRYRCGNEHAFTTLEIYAAEPTAKQRAEDSLTAVEMESKATKLRKRNKSIVDMIADGKSSAAVARIAGLSLERTLRVAKQFRQV